MMIGDVFASTGGRVWDAGDDSPVLVFIHGSGQNHLGFQLQARFLANRGFRVLVPDMPAHFKTGGEPLESVAAMADWYSGVLDAAGVLAGAYYRAFPRRIGCLGMGGAVSQTGAEPCYYSQRIGDSDKRGVAGYGASG